MKVEIIKNIMQNVIYDLAFVIEGHSNEELPEQILTSVRISKVAAQKTQLLPQIYINKYQQREQQKQQQVQPTINNNNSVSDSDKKNANNEKMKPYNNNYKKAKGLQIT
eukprot:380434_1